MGADSFLVMSYGSTAKEAFNYAVREAQHEYGSGGYTGTIAEKNSFKLIDLPKGVDPVEYANKFLSDESKKEEIDKWAPALCVRVGDAPFGDSKYLFFGFASS
jgi:hypothetical protein